MNRVYTVTEEEIEDIITRAVSKALSIQQTTAQEAPKSNHAIETGLNIPDYSRKEAAERLRVSTQTIDKLISTKELSSYRIGKKVFIRAESVNNYARA